MTDDLEKTITGLWEAGDEWRDVMPVPQAFTTVRSVIDQLDRGELRVAEIGEDVTVNEWVKLAILMYAALTSAGYHGHLAPIDAFWGNRYCEVDDADGHTVGFQSPTDPSLRVPAPG